MTRLIAIIAALAMTVAGACAATTNPTIAGAWINIGTGPLTVQRVSNAVVEVFSSATTPGAGAIGHRLLTSDPFLIGDSTVWARTLDGSTTTLVVTPAPAGSGGGGSVTIAGSLPAFAATPAFNISQIGGAALALGQTTMAGSIPVVLPSNQSAIPVTGTFWQATQPVSWSGMTVGLSGTLPAFAATPTFNIGTAPTITVVRAAIAPAGSSALESGRVLKASAGSILSIYTYTQSTSDRWVLVFNSTTVPADGAVTPKYYWKAKTDGASGWLWWEWNTPADMPTGISVACSSTGPFVKTAVSDCAFSAQVQ